MFGVALVVFVVLCIIFFVFGAMGDDDTCFLLFIICLVFAAICFFGWIGEDQAAQDAALQAIIDEASSDFTNGKVNINRYVEDEVYQEQIDKLYIQQQREAIIGNATQVVAATAT